MTSIHSAIANLQTCIGDEMNKCFEEGKKVGRDRLLETIMQTNYKTENDKDNELICNYKNFIKKLAEEMEN